MLVLTSVGDSKGVNAGAADDVGVREGRGLGRRGGGGRGVVS